MCGDQNGKRRKVAAIFAAAVGVCVFGVFLFRCKAAARRLAAAPQKPGPALKKLNKCKLVSILVRDTFSFFYIIQNLKVRCCAILNSRGKFNNAHTHSYIYRYIYIYAHKCLWACVSARVCCNSRASVLSNACMCCNFTPFPVSNCSPAPTYCSLSAAAEFLCAIRTKRTRGVSHQPKVIHSKMR